MNKILLLIGASAIFMMAKPNTDTEEKRAFIVARLKARNELFAWTSNLTSKEVNLFYTYYNEYEKKDLAPPLDLYNQLNAILKKYGVI